MSTHSLGLCLGASTIKAVELIDDNGVRRVGKVVVRIHESNPRRILAGLIAELSVDRYDHVMITGRKFRDIVNGASITEPEAVEHAIRFTQSQSPVDCTALASLGAESFIVYLLNGDGAIATVETGNKCASGTGEFFLQQIGRMDIGVEKAVALARDSEMYRVSGRCSVFCKSDCTHALNKGIPIGRVAAGLSRMMADKVMELLEKVHDKRIMAVGGVTRNSVVMNFLRASVDRLIIPDHADVFEALGAACCAMDSKAGHSIDASNLFKKEKHTFTWLSPISRGASLVEFKEMAHGKAAAGDECILGLDVGSTTTKAVLLRIADEAVLASVYLRTNGNPVKASRECYAAINGQLPAPVEVVGLATTGSGRHIAGLHAQTDAIINEIIAHATGAAHYDAGVDTIFEIGGQDAKYTYLTNAVPSDYAMNEACSAGTGSFLEESAKESLGIGVAEIADIALSGARPPNFNDQCAAFISSDIKTAGHEGVERNDIVAGLVYSICMNYVNRVKGQRPVGAKIFMQGGVCYNRAVPMAMAALIERPIVVPPDPGLIGAFGVALELKHRIESGLFARGSFDLAGLAAREIEYGKSFVCPGGTEKCDLGCEVNMLIVNGTKFPFGGACNKYYNQVHHLKYDAAGLDLVRARQDLMFSDCSATAGVSGKTVGISRSYLANTLYPLYHRFFTELGLSVRLSDTVDPQGIKRRRSSFCYPGEVAHGCFLDLLGKKTDFIFLPKVMGLHVDKSVNPGKQHQSTCVLLQSEAYYLKSAFRDLLAGVNLIDPVIDFSDGWESAGGVFIDIARRMGVTDRGRAAAAFRAALAHQREVNARIKEIGARAIEELSRDPSRIAVVLFGRPYNAFAHEANLGIPAKFASRGVQLIPWDSLAFEDEPCDPDMCWATGQNILKAASLVKKHPRLFGAFITNFSCGPDSFLVGQFRDVMQSKPSLTLELDSHTADAGVNTRIEAFLDIVERYRQLKKADRVAPPFIRARIVFPHGMPHFVASDGRTVSFRDPRVLLLIPSMGRLGSEILSAAFRGLGVRSEAVPVYDFDVLKLGRANASCKECLPLQLTVGGLLDHLKKRPADEMTAYFMPFTPGNCRFPQYRVFLNGLIDRQQLANVAVFSLTAEKGYMYQAFSPLDRLSILKGFIVHDVMEDIRNAIFVLARDRNAAQAVFDAQWRRILDVFEQRRVRDLYPALESAAAELARVPLRTPLARATRVSLMGEIFVRRDYYSGQDLLERLAERDIVVKRSHFFEWLKYVDTLIKRGVYQPGFDLKSALQFQIKLFLQNHYERRIKSILAKSGLYEFEIADIDAILDYGKDFFDIEFRGESILMAGNFFREMLHGIHGAISIGPFACMPTRVIEAVLSAESTMAVKQRLDRVHGIVNGNGAGIVNLPFLSIESDGNPFPQIIQARIEAFCLQVKRLHAAVRAGHSRDGIPV